MGDLINDGRPFVGARAHEHDISKASLRVLLSDHRVRRVLRGVYVDATAPDTRALRACALHLIKPRAAVFYGVTVAFLLGVDAFPPGARFDFTPQCVVPHGSSRCRCPLVRCREGYLPEPDLDVVEGLVVTNAVRTTVDMLRSLWRPYALSAADSMARAGLVSREGVMAYIGPMKRYPGIVQARALAPVIERRTESPGESWLRLRLVDAGFSIPEPQIDVFDGAGVFRGRLDNGYREAKVGTEYDGREFHSDDEHKDHDEGRRGYLTDVLGWRVAVARREQIFGEDPAFEVKVGEWLGIPPLPRRW